MSIEPFERFKVSKIAMSWELDANTTSRGMSKPEFDTICWTEQRERDLRKMCLDGMSAGKIAKTFGDCTRNAIIGKVHRMGLRLTSKRAIPALGMRPSKVVDRPRKVKKKVVRPVPVMPKFKVEPLPPAPAAYIPTVGVPLLALENHMCRWPLGSHMEPATLFCGARGYPYCGHHARLAYNPVQPRRRVKEIP